MMSHFFRFFLSKKQSNIKGFNIGNLTSKLFTIKTYFLVLRKDIVVHNFFGLGNYGILQGSS